MVPAHLQGEKSGLEVSSLSSERHILQIGTPELLYYEGHLIYIAALGKVFSSVTTT